MGSSTVTRTWTRTSGNWRDTVALTRTEDGWRLRGKIRNSRPNDLVDSPFEGLYQIDLDDQWQTRMATVQMVRGHRTAEMQIRVDEDGCWRDLDETHLDALDGVRDIDVFLTPATNTIPIRRLDLPIGSAGHVPAVFVSLDENDRLVASRLDQRYERVDEMTYTYTSFGEDGEVAFRAELIVDADGVIERYGDLWVTAPAV